MDIMLTSNGGASWKKVGALPLLLDTPISGGSKTYEQMFDLIFRSSNEIMFSTAVRLNPPSQQGDIFGLLYETSDAGTSWDGFYGLGAPIRKFFRISDTEVFGFGVGMWNSGEANYFLAPGYFLWRNDSQEIGHLGDSLLRVDGAFIDRDSIYLSYRDTLYRSDRSLDLWKRVENYAGPSVRFNSTTLVIGSIRSTDNGETWSTIDLPSGKRFGSTVGVGWIMGAELYKSVDAAASWRRVDFAPLFREIHTIDSAVAYGHDTDGILYRTVSGGWKLDVTSLPTPVRQLKLYPNPAANTVVASTAVLWFDLLGRNYSVLSEKLGDEYRYDVSALNAGAYVVRFEGGSQIVIVQ